METGALGQSPVPYWMLHNCIGFGQNLGYQHWCRQWLIAHAKFSYSASSALRTIYTVEIILQVEIILDGVAVDSLDTRCCDHLCACCSGYFGHRLINDKPTYHFQLKSKWQQPVGPPIYRSFRRPCIRSTKCTYCTSCMQKYSSRIKSTNYMIEKIRAHRHDTQ